MKIFIAVTTVIGAITLHAATANAALVESIVRVTNGLQGAIVVPPPSLGGGQFTAVNWPGCTNGTLDSAAQQITLEPGDCGAWATISTGGTSGTSGSISFSVGNGESVGVDWDYPWICGPDNVWGWCSPSANTSINLPSGSSTFPPCSVVWRGGYQSQGADGHIDGAIYDYVIDPTPGTTCTPLTAAPAPPPPPMNAPTNCTFAATCGGYVSAECDMEEDTFTAYTLQQGQWLEFATAAPPFYSSPLFINGYGNLMPGATLPVMACYSSGGVTLCTPSSTVTGPTCDTPTGGGSSGGGSSGGGTSSGGGHPKPVLQ